MGRIVALFMMQMTGSRLASLAFPLALLLFAASCGGADTSAGVSEDAGSETEGVEAADSDAANDAAADETEAGTEVAALAGLDGEFATIGGASIDLATLQGEDVVLWFWAPW